jgi:hypothetical protein
LAFDDPQIQEASKTFLYGFYRSTVVVCASAVETQLKRIAKVHRLTTQFSREESDKDPGAFELIERARAARLLKRDLADQAKDLFWFRNDVAHRKRDPKSDEAKERLGIARMLVTEMMKI